MLIPEAVFARFVPLPPATTEGALEMVQQRYCTVLTARAACPQKCERCRATLDAIFRLGRVRSPSGALRWRLDALAEGRITLWTSEPKEMRIPLDSLGLPRTGNPFETVLEQLK